MTFMDNIKNDQRTQILVAGMVFFAIAFPVYFSFAASEVDSYSPSGKMGTYEITGELSYHWIGEGTENVNDGDEVMVIANSDAAGDEIKGKNIVGVRATVTYSETNEETPGLPCTGYQPAEDTVNTRLMHDVFEQSRSAIVSGESVAIEWYDSSLLGITVENMTDSMIELLLSGMGIGDGEHSLNIGVIANSGSGNPGCGAGNDPGESVSWMIELISLDYTITLVE